MKVHPLGLVVVLASAAARAESPTTWYPCTGAWWVNGSSAAPTDVSGLPPEPIVLLPARWSSNFASAPDLSETALVVEVQDEVGRPVAGTIGVGLPGLEEAGDPPVEGMLWWRPAAPLAPDAYTARVTVKSPPTSEGYCGFTAFESSVRFDVAAEAANVVPRATTEVTATVFQFEALNYSAWSCGQEGAVACAEVPGVCCDYLWPGDTYEFHTLVDVATHVPGGAYYQALEVEVGSLGGHDETRTFWVYPVPDDPWRTMMLFLPPNYQSPFDATWCATTRLWNLHELAVVSTSNDCAKAADAERLPEPGPIACDPVRCAEQAVGDGAPESVEASAVDPDPAATTRDGGGCGAGPGGWSWLAVASALGQGACRRRRARGAGLTAGR